MIILHQIKFHCIECRHYFIRVDGKRISNNPMESLNGRLKDYFMIDMDIQISIDLEIGLCFV